ncbi:ABC transporter ATP-binding protein [Mesorhizobium sp. STM 4661]|uniref:ABC transporter ATP-binding protein n=1 Tax=Mesorhizobium sp. STM 4661 TaxID=1297570 RepID=UPI0002BF1285|nr:ABC transporter ATP-binding protein [Mesorhizobium sp. STM 4661]CCV15340.1 Spermidine/putrescine import ATP-binding protein potA [Mesorhizobium sp. STM 4661]
MQQAVGSYVLSLENVAKTYPGNTKRALDRVSFEVAAGEFFSILGPSGSGKTTILRTIAGFEKPDEGRVVMAGGDVTHLPPNRRDLRTVFQSYALFPHLTIGENVQYPLRMSGMGKLERTRKAAEALELVAMEPLAGRLPHLLSGGQRQRAALARAVVSRPQLLLLDEPLGALDLRLRQQMQHTLVSLQKELGIAFVYVTHDQGEALSMSDRVLVMREGRIAQLGRPQDLYFKPRSEFVAEFVGNSNMLPVEFTADHGSYVGSIGGVTFPEMRGDKSGKARVAVRYDNVHIYPAKENSGTSRLSGIVENVLFLGTNIEVDMRCGDLRIMGSLPAGRADSIVAGQAVSIGLDLADASVFHV